MSNVRTVTLLGATGSIGRQTVSLIMEAPERFSVEAVTAHRDVLGLAKIAKAVNASFAAIADHTLYAALKDALAGTSIEIAAGPQALLEAAMRPSEWVLSAIMGSAGLAPTLKAIERGAIIALANKESLVCAGNLMLQSAQTSGATLLPVDSEHNAIFQVFSERHRSHVEKLILTASGGPFRTRSLNELHKITPAQATAHPNWSMGQKISVDSATMMNKGLETIECYYLFGLPESQIEVVIHPEQVIHSCVAYEDGSVLAQLGVPDMRTPIAYTLAWPERMLTSVKRLSLTDYGCLTFEAPDLERFPALSLAREALRTDKGLIFNTANEVAVAAFLREDLPFLAIVDMVATVMEEIKSSIADTIPALIEFDKEVRQVTKLKIYKNLRFSD